MQPFCEPDTCFCARRRYLASMKRSGDVKANAGSSLAVDEVFDDEIGRERREQDATPKVSRGRHDARRLRERPDRGESVWQGGPQPDAHGLDSRTDRVRQQLGDGRRERLHTGNRRTLVEAHVFGRRPDEQ